MSKSGVSRLDDRLCHRVGWRDRRREVEKMTA